MISAKKTVQICSRILKTRTVKCRGLARFL